MIVTVVNGDTHRRVRGAVVRIGNRSARTNAKGVAELLLRRRAPLVVSVRKPGYAEKDVRMPFQRRRKVTVRVFRPALQWTMYGADATRSQAQTEIQVRPPFRVVWSAGIGSLVEFPAVVSEGVAFVGNYQGTIVALDMRTGKRVDPRPARREDGLVPRGRRRRRGRARDGRDRARARPAHAAGFAGTSASARRSSRRRS